MKNSLALLTCALRLVSGSSIKPQTDFLAAYNAVAPQLLPPAQVPTNGSNSIKAYDATAVYSSAATDSTAGGIQRRQAACQAYPPGGGPPVRPDTPEAFEAYPPFHSAALSAPTPAGYYPVSNFRDLNASASTAAYLGLNSSLTSYNPFQCASQCNSISGCVSFNIFFERDPTVNADDTACPNPPSLTRIKCTFWGVPLTSTTATNVGQYQSQFHVVIAGSDAYNAFPTPPSAFQVVKSLNNATLAPSNAADLMGIQTFPNAAYSPQACADACAAHNAQGSGRVCKTFGAYVTYKNGAGAMFTCAYYSGVYGSESATNYGAVDAKGDKYTFDYSYTFSSSS